MTHPAVAIYTKSRCFGCNVTKRLLAERGATYTEIDMEKDPAALAYVKTLGHQQAPVVVLGDGTSWSGLVPALIDQHFGKKPTK